MTPQQAIEKLQRQLDLIEDLKTKSQSQSNFGKWRRDTEVAIEKTFGTNTRHIKDFKEINYSLMVFSGRTTQSDVNQAYWSGLRSACEMLESCIDEIKEFGLHSNGNSAQSTNALIENICQRFHLVSRCLRHRHDTRTTIEIQDEYDVQDLLNALLLLHFDDVRPEESTPSYAGGCSRVDFLMKKEKTVVEVKKTRNGLTDRNIGEQLIIDVERYRSHPDCETLICFIYDPEGRIKNPRGLERDLNGSRDNIYVQVIITPSGV